MLKTIVIVNDFAFINGGAGKVALQSARALARQGFRVILFTAVGPVSPDLTADGVEVVCLGQSDILAEKNRLKAVVQGIWNRKARHAFERVLAGLDPRTTVVHLHAWIKALSPSLLAVTARMDFPVAITLHDYFLFCPNGGLFNYPQQRICELEAGSLACLRCHCDARSYPQKVWRYVRQLVQNKWLARNRRIALVAISKLNEEVSRPYLAGKVRHWYYVQNPIGLNQGAYADIVHNHVYLFMGRLSKEKGAELFCRAVTELGLEGVVLGDGYLRKELEAKYPRIRFAGWQTGVEKERLVRQAKALVFPSLWYEGAPLTIVEMKSYGIPCIVPDRCAAAEQIKDGATGYVFQTGNMESLKNAILKFEKTDKAAMQQNILHGFVPAQYSVRTHVENLVSVYSGMLQQNTNI